MGSNTYKAIAQDEEELIDESHSTIWISSRWTFSKALAMRIGFVFLALLILVVLWIFKVSHIGMERSLGSPINFFPAVPIIYTEFVKAEEYWDTSELGDKAWDDMLPLGAGYVRVPYPRQHNLPKSVLWDRSNESEINDPERSEIYQASLIHQLHCLATLRRVIIDHDKGTTSKYSTPKHVFHCLDIIRQGILCAGDTTLTFGHENDELNKFNTPTTFLSNPDIVPESDENDIYWRVSMHPKGGGVVIVPDEWAAERGLPPSAAAPPKYPGSSVYQVEVFHQLHCLEVVRERLNHPNHQFFAYGSEGYNHSLHCVDWIRQGMMCNADVNLSPTEDYLNFGEHGRYRCRDLNAVTQWTLNHRFMERREFLESKGIDLTDHPLH
ncbi:hypothetical protein NA57DRAFT_80387 [Rhizodiscina lignyota]|uniref:Uncharacterized protein n=1 Tax=Rhizodiscina lignyota TaxID=1504668 RepID=A0A9P4M1G4_9PEZI|nr:hypothetical protein NA57DRAFT_80387 [Rhizodiscina lignyota]